MSSSSEKMETKRMGKYLCMLSNNVKLICINSMQNSHRQEAPKFDKNNNKSKTLLVRDE
jgi:hypothetical protein